MIGIKRLRFELARKAMYKHATLAEGNRNALKTRATDHRLFGIQQA
jgi:hypothetical protein